MRFSSKNQATMYNPALRRMIDELERYLTDLETRHGIVPLLAQGNASAPVNPTLTVTGSRGFFSVVATLASTYIHHFEVQYSSTTPFESSTDFVSVLGTGDANLLLYSPNTTRYFRTRMRLTSSDWSSWVYSGAISSGVFSSV